MWVFVVVAPLADADGGPARWVFLTGFGMPLTLVPYLCGSFWVSYPIVVMLIPVFCSGAIFGPDPLAQTFVPRLRFRAAADAAILRPAVSYIQSKRAAKAKTVPNAPAKQ